MTIEERYPVLMRYIAERSNLPTKDAWEQFRKDEASALAGEFGELAADLERAIGDFGVAQAAKGESPYPYNSSMGLFLGLPLRENHEPPVGYYFARQVTNHFLLGSAQREIQALLAQGATLKVVAARSKQTGEPIRFTTFLAHQVQIDGNAIVCRNSRKHIRLSSNWSIETALQTAAAALRSGAYYGYRPPSGESTAPEPQQGSETVSVDLLLY